MTKGDDSSFESPQGISSAIIPVSREDQESTKGKSKAFIASDTHIPAGKEKEDGSSPSINPLEGEMAIQPDNCNRKKLIIDGDPFGMRIDLIPSLSIEDEVKNDKVEPFTSGNCAEEVVPVEADDLAEVHPHEE
ncbi:hypothetical protein V6N11_005927 [Hibiscus sabdariffa]|uniref:Uncharacterized protein n=1 Tax=Hibiscus sabdariffa TaxID=183260 RepID=A0ABR2RP67_9ROSI